MKNLSFIFLVLLLFSSCYEERLKSIENKLGDIDQFMSSDVSKKLTIEDVCKEMKLSTDDIKIGEPKEYSVLDGVKVKSQCFYVEKDPTAFYILVDVLDSKNKYVHAKFIPVPHHSLTVIDNETKPDANVIGFLEVIDMSKDDKKNKYFRHPKLHKGTLVACVDVTTPNEDYSLLVIPPQSAKHSVGDHPVKIHTSRHPIDDPRG